MIRSRKILDSARGQTCTFRFPGIWNTAPATTVWAYLNGGRFRKGMGRKAHDILGAHACFACHTYLDTGHGTKPRISNETLLECVLGGVTETYVRLVKMGLVIIPLDAERLSSERPVKPRKPPQQRTPIPQPAKPRWPQGRKINSANNLRRKEPSNA